MCLYMPKMHINSVQIYLCQRASKAHSFRETPNVCKCVHSRLTFWTSLMPGRDTFAKINLQKSLSNASCILILTNFPNLSKYGYLNYSCSKGPDSFISTYKIFETQPPRESTPPPTRSTPPYGKFWISHCMPNLS